MIAVYKPRPEKAEIINRFPQSSIHEKKWSVVDWDDDKYIIAGPPRTLFDTQFQALTFKRMLHESKKVN